MNVKSHRTIIVIFFGFLIIMFVAKNLGILNEKLMFLFETKILKTITENVLSMALAFFGSWLGTGGSPTSKGVNFGFSCDSFHNNNVRGKSHSFIIPSIVLIISIFVPDWLKPFLIGYSLGFAIHIISDFIHNKDAFTEKRFILTSFVLYAITIILFELF